MSYDIQNEVFIPMGDASAPGIHRIIVSSAEVLYLFEGKDIVTF